jgi:hypothetical protein
MGNVTHGTADKGALAVDPLTDPDFAGLDVDSRALLDALNAAARQAADDAIAEMHAAGLPAHRIVNGEPVEVWPSAKSQVKQ